MTLKDYIMCLLFASSIGSIIVLLILQLKIWFTGEVIATEPNRIVLGLEIFCSLYAIIGLFIMFHRKE